MESELLNRKFIFWKAKFGTVTMNSGNIIIEL